MIVDISISLGLLLNTLNSMNKNNNMKNFVIWSAQINVNILIEKRVNLMTT